MDVSTDCCTWPVGEEGTQTEQTVLKSIETQTIEPEESKESEIDPVISTDKDTQTVEPEEYMA